MSLISLICRCAPKRVSEERASTVFQNDAQIVICAICNVSVFTQASVGKPES